MTIIRNIAALYPCKSRNEQPLIGAWIAVADGRVAAYGQEPCPLPPGGPAIDARGMLAIPGLINMHNHFYQSLTRALPGTIQKSILDWLRHMYEIWQGLDPQSLHAGASLAAAEHLLTGVTTSLDHAYLYPGGQSDLLDEEIAAVRTLGLRIHAIRGCALVLETTLEQELKSKGLWRVSLVEDEDTIVRACERAIARHHDASPLSKVRIGVGPTQLPFDQPSLLHRLIELSNDAGCDRHTHLGPGPGDVQICRSLHRCRPTEYLRRIGWLGPKSTLAHCLLHTEEDIASMRGTGAGMVHCPSQNMRTGAPIGPVPETIRAGVPVAIGVDGAASNDANSLLAEMRLTYLMHRLYGTHENYKPRDWLTAHDVLWAATRVAAGLLGREELGRIAPGAAADIVLIDLNQVGYAGGLHDPLAAVLMAGDSTIVHTTMIGGETVVEKGELKTASVRRIIDDANRESVRLIRNAEARLGRPVSLAPQIVAAMQA